MSDNLQREALREAAPIILEARHVTRRFPASGGRVLTANNNVSLSIRKGETYGIVGESGCGKSTFVRFLALLDQPTEGEILYHGSDISHLKGEPLRLKRRQIQMVLQDPNTSLNPKMRVRDIICEPLLNFGEIRRSERDKVCRELLEMVELSPDFADRFPHSMSGGQRQRVAIARALALKPEMLILDEATCALDVSVQKSVLELITRLQRTLEITVVFICHDIALVQSMADRIAVMYLGHIVEELPSDKLTDAAHPYTKALIGAIFDLNMDFSKPIETLEGEVPSPLDAPTGCPFQSRCSSCMEICRRELPPYYAVGAHHRVACHLCLPTEPHSVI